MTEKDDQDWADAVAAFIHTMPKREPCEHDFQGWREFEGGNGGERVCTKCGLGAMAHTMSCEGFD